MKSNSKQLKQQAAEAYMTVTEAVTEVGTVAFACVKHTPAIVRKHKAKCEAEMDAIFAVLLAK